MFEKELAQIPGLTGVTSDLQIKSPQVTLEIDRNRAAALHVSPEQIENGLFAAYGPQWVSTIYAPGDQYRVLLEVDRRFQDDHGKISALRIRSQDGHLVPMDSLVRYTTQAGLTTVNHYGQSTAVTLSFDLLPGVALGDVVGQIQEAGRAQTSRHGYGALSRHGASIPAIDAQSGAAAGGGDFGGLHRAGHFVREFCTSTDGALGAALGRIRGAAHAVSF